MVNEKDPSNIIRETVSLTRAVTPKEFHKYFLGRILSLLFPELVSSMVLAITDTTFICSEIVCYFWYIKFYKNVCIFKEQMKVN